MRSPSLVGVVHLPPLPGSPRAGQPCWEIAAGAVRDARTLQTAGFDLVLLENFGDAPFFAERVPPVTVSAITSCAVAVREACPGLPLGVNVLRNDAEAALAIAAVVGAHCISVNVHTGARVTDQGVVQGRAAETLAPLRDLGMPIATRVPWFRKQMVLGMCGTSRGPLMRSLPLQTRPLSLP